MEKGDKFIVKKDFEKDSYYNICNCKVGDILIFKKCDWWSMHYFIREDGSESITLDIYYDKYVEKFKYVKRKKLIDILLK